MEDLLFYSPFAGDTGRITSPRYRWRSWARGKEPFVIIQWTHSGCGEFVRRGHILPVPAGHAFICLVPERSQYRYPPSGVEPWVAEWINFYGAGSVRLWKKFRETFGDVVPLAPESPAGLALRRLIADVGAGRTTDRFRHSAECYAFFAEWARALGLGESGRRDVIERAIQTCRTRYREPLGVKQLAAEAGVTREHFSRLFVGRTGVPPARYLRDLRLASAAELERDGDLTLAEIAMRCGFSSPLQLRRARDAAKALSGSGRKASSNRKGGRRRDP